MKIGLDMVSGDFGTAATILAVKSSLEAGIETVPIGPADVIQEFRDQGVFCVETASMPEQHGLRFSPGHPFKLGVRLLVDEGIDALVSAGNTQSIIASSLRLMPKGSALKGPVLPQGIPDFEWSEEENRIVFPHTTTLVDVGANVDVSAEELVTFVVMGATYREAMSEDSAELPVAGLISVGHEDYKGNRVTIDAFRRLRAMDGKLMHVDRMAEGSDILSSNFDVIGGDGFSLNPIIKLAEKAVEKFLLSFRAANNAVEGDKSLTVRQAQIDLMSGLLGEATSAALLLGLEFPVYKAHGKSDYVKLTDAVKFAARVTPLEIQAKTASSLRALGLAS